MSKNRYACLFIPALTDESSSLHSALAEACLRFTPQVAVREGEAVFLEIGGSRALFPDHSLEARLHALAKRFDGAGRVRFADDVPTALALARFECEDETKLPLDALHDYADPFRRAQDPAKSREKIQGLILALLRLGITDLADFSRFPIDGLASRFGQEALQASRFLRDRGSIAWPEFKPALVIEERTELLDVETQSACHDLESTFPLLRELLDRAAARLWARGLKASKLRIEFDLESRETLKWTIALAFPQSSTQVLLKLIQERLRAELGRSPLMAPAVCLLLRIEETAVARGGQRDFFSQKEEKRDALSSLLSILESKLGQERAFFAAPVDRHLPEKAWHRARPPQLQDHVSSQLPPQLKAQHAPAPITQVADRPMRLLIAPEPLEKEKDWLRCKPLKRRWWITDWIGPERISAEWWLNDDALPTRRDYYRVRAHTGEELWIFESGSDLYLHGYFD